MVARDSRVVDPDQGIEISTDDVFAFDEINLALVVLQAMSAGRCGERRTLHIRRLAGEGITKAVDRPDEVGGAALLADRLAYFGGKAGEIRLGDERVGPDPLLEIRLRERPWSILDEQLEEPKSLGGEVNRLALPEKLTRLRVEGRVAETNAHRIVGRFYRCG